MSAPDGLKPGDRVWFADYGNGEVESTSQFRLWIRWDRAGLLDHDWSFVRWLKPQDPAAERSAG